MRNWIKGFLILYLLLTIFQNMAASEKYEKYFKFFSGFLLLLYVIKPVMAIRGEDILKMLEYQDFWQQLDSFRQESSYFESAQSKTAVKKYEQALAEEAADLLKEKGLQIEYLSVSLNERYELQEIQVCFMSNGKDLTLEKTKAVEFLAEHYQIGTDQIFFIQANDSG